jgi:succinyl-CoA synthetase beta subunit/citryl-CoA synthetase large subunit
MAKLLEDAAKGVLREVGVGVPYGRAAAEPEEAATIAREIGAAVVVKALVGVGKRARAGGVRHAATPEDARREAAQLLGASVYGERVRTVLVESRLDIERELYASIAFDSVLRAPLLLLSASGGVDIEDLAREAPERLIRVPLDEHMVVHRCREGWRRAGFVGESLLAVSSCTAGIVSAFFRVEARLLEVNPLVLTRTGAAMAADAVMVLDDDALARHPQLEALVTPDGALEEAGTRLERLVRDINKDPSPGRVRLSEFSEGVIGAMVSGGGGGLLFLDLLDSLGVRPMNTFDITPGPIDRKMYLTARAILSEPRVRGLIVASNITNFNRVDVKVRAVVQALEDEGVDLRTFPVVMRLTGPGASEARAAVQRVPGIHYLEDEVTLDDAIRMIVQLVDACGARS